MNYLILCIKTVNTAINKIMKIMFLIRSVNHFTFHESTIRYLAKNEHQVYIYFNPDWSKGFTDRAVKLCAKQFPNIKFPSINHESITKLNHSLKLPPTLLRATIKSGKLVLINSESAI